MFGCRFGRHFGKRGSLLGLDLFFRLLFGFTRNLLNRLFRQGLLWLDLLLRLLLGGLSLFLGSLRLLHWGFSLLDWSLHRGLGFGDNFFDWLLFLRFLRRGLYFSLLGDRFLSCLQSWRNRLQGGGCSFYWLLGGLSLVSRHWLFRLLVTALDLLSLLLLDCLESRRFRFADSLGLLLTLFFLRRLLHGLLLGDDCLLDWGLGLDDLLGLGFFTL